MQNPITKPVVTLNKIKKAGYSGNNKKFCISFKNGERPISNIEIILVYKDRSIQKKVEDTIISPETLFNVEIAINKGKNYDGEINCVLFYQDLKTKKENFCCFQFTQLNYYPKNLENSLVPKNIKDRMLACC